MDVQAIPLQGKKKVKKTNGSHKTYAYKEALAASTEYFGGDELAASVWINKYALKDSQGNIYEKTPEDMHRRIASEIARIEKKYVNPLSEEEIFALLRNFKYIILTVKWCIIKNKSGIRF